MHISAMRSLLSGGPVLVGPILFVNGGKELSSSEELHCWIEGGKL